MYAAIARILPVPGSRHHFAKSRIQHIDVNAGHCCVQIKLVAIGHRPHFLSAPRRRRDCPLKRRPGPKGDDAQVAFLTTAAQANASMSCITLWSPSASMHIVSNKVARVKRISDTRCSWMTIPQMSANASAEYVLDSPPRWTYEHECFSWKQPGSDRKRYLSRGTKPESESASTTKQFGCVVHRCVSRFHVQRRTPMVR